MKRLKIGLITPGFSADEADWCIPAILNLVRILGDEHEVHVFTLRYPYRAQRYQVYGANVCALGGATKGGLRRFPILARALALVRREARRQPFDVLHGLWADEAGCVAVMAGRLLGTPSIVSIMGGELVGMPGLAYGVQLSRIGRMLTRLSLRLADAVTVGSRLLRSEAEQHVAPERLWRMPLGVDTSLFAPSPERTKAPGPHLICVASLVPVKDHHSLLISFVRVAAAFPDAELHLVGSGPLHESLAQLSMEFGIRRKVHFHGAIAHDRLSAFYNASDLFVLSSRYESQSLAVLEAAACQLPAAGTAVGVLPELLPDDCLVAPGDVDALAPAITGLLANRSRRRLLAEHLHRRVVDEYALDKTIPASLALYHKLR